MVASTHWLASAAGMAVLKAGGNAFDAAVATGLTLQVVEPHLNGPGGEVPVIGHDAASGETFVLSGQGTAPQAATIEAFESVGITDLVPGNGLLPATVPAAFGTWMLLLSRYGTLPLREVAKYAIGYAGDGYPMLRSASGTIEAMAPTFTEHWPTSARIYLGNGVPAPGSRFVNADLAATYGRLVAEAEAAGSDRENQIEAARRTWYEGFIAEAIDSFIGQAQIMDVTGRANRGLLTGGDLAAWRAEVEPPVTFDFHGLTVCKTGPWGQGPVFLQQLALLEGFDLAGMGAGSADLVHTITECGKLAFADREAWYGDPKTFDVPLAGLLDRQYAAERRPLVTGESSGSLVPGSPDGRTQRCLATRWPGSAIRALASMAGTRPRPVIRPWPLQHSDPETPVTWTLATGSGTWYRRPPAAAGCRARQSCLGSASAWAPGARCSRSRRDSPARWPPAVGRAPRCRRAWRFATASRTWRSVLRAAISRTSGRWGSSSTTSYSA